MESYIDEEKFMLGASSLQICIIFPFSFDNVVFYFEFHDVLSFLHGVDASNLACMMGLS